jgi:flagellar hook-associated protein 1 FlgK
MPGLFDTLNLGARSLQVQQQALQITGHNIANVNNPAYARQRVNIETSAPVDTPIGPIGTGVVAVGVQQIRSQLTDQQIQSEASVRGFLEAQQQATQDAEAGLGQSVASSANGADSSQASGDPNGIAGQLTSFFNSFQGLSTDPTSVAARQNVIGAATNLASRFNLTDQALAKLQSQLDTSVQSDTTSANQLLSSIADLNRQIADAETGSPGAANDLRDLRQAKIEELSKLVNIDVGQESNGSVDISIGSTSFVSGNQAVDSLEAYDPGSGHLLLRAQSSGTALTPTGGSIAGTIEARDGDVADLRNRLDTLASQLISQVNAVHAGGYGLNGTSGTVFFTGSGASDIQVNTALANDPTLLQASGTSGAVGDNQVALALAQLANSPNSGLNNQTFSQNYNQTIGAFGQSLSSVNSRLSDQDTIDSMLAQQRDSESGVSLDEEMTNMMKFQRAFQASAQIITTVDQMLQTVIQMKST